MQEHPSTELLNQYQKRVLTPDLFLSIQRHIDCCPACFQKTKAAPAKREDYEALLAALTPDPLEEPYHLSKTEMAAYLDGTLIEVELEAVQSHVEVCSDCLREIETLRAASAFSNELTPPQVGALTFFQTWPPAAKAACLLLLVSGLVLMSLFLIRIRNRSDQSVNANKPDPGTASQHSQTNNNSPSPRQNESTVAPNGDLPEQKGLARLSPHLRDAINTALRTQSLEKPQVLAELRGTKSTLLGEPDSSLKFRVLSPVGQVVQNTNPTFRWQPLGGASSYVVTITDDKLNEVATSNAITAREWRVPTSLQRGSIYLWQVTARKDGKKISAPVTPAPQARFKILDDAHNKELLSAKRALANYHLGLGVLYARLGLLDEAEGEFQAQLRATPHSTIAQKFLESVRSSR